MELKKRKGRMFRIALTVSMILMNLLNVSAQMKIDTLDIENYQIKVLKIPDKLNEISSLEYHDGFYWGNNDSGGDPELYKISPQTGKIVQTVWVENAVNVDWEEIAFGGGFVFIADTGNNAGNRNDLTVYYFPLSELQSEQPKITVEAKKIEFIFPEQKNFNPGNHKTNFDCEAMFYYNNKLHLFTKEWSKLETTHYTLDILPGKQSANKIDSFKTNYLVTGAVIDDNPISNTHGFYLIGYTPDGVALISGFSVSKKNQDQLFSAKTKFSLPIGFTPQVGQTEGITIKPENPNVLCYSNEEFRHQDFFVKQSIQCIHSLAQ